MEKVNVNGEVYHSPKIGLKDEFGNSGIVKQDEKTGKNYFSRSGWAQVQEKHFKTIKFLFNEKPLAANIFMFFLEHSDKTNCLIVSYDTLIEIFNKSRKTISTAIKFLKDKKIITILKSGNMNVYCINSNIVWKDYQSKLKYAKFTANVIISQQEQDVDYKINVKGNKEIITKK